MEKLNIAEYTEKLQQFKKLNTELMQLLPVGGITPRKRDKKVICAYEGCTRLVMARGKYADGTQSYRIYCATHCRVGVDKTKFNKGIIPNSACSICGWDKAPCDRHRLVPKNGYTKENVIILCPNCHRIETFKNFPFKKNFKISI